MKFNDLQSWLSWQEKLHLSEIDLGLERIQKVASALGIESRWSVPVVTVAGTNGKGSSVAILESLYLSAGYQVGSYTSPHLLRYNERIKINRQPVADQLICEAFEQVEQARQSAGNISLTYFEFGTLAAFIILKQASLDVMILEVGLGGRLDAVNIIDADVALITPVALDHQSWLGDTREEIAGEKAGIIKSNSTVVCSDPDPAEAVIKQAKIKGVMLFCLGNDFRLEPVQGGCRFCSSNRNINKLPLPSLTGDYQLDNAAAAIQVTSILNTRLPVSEEAVSQALRNVQLAGRYQKIADAPQVIVDVAHNEHAVASLANNLKQDAVPGQTFAVLAMLEDKAICDALGVIDAEIDRYYLAGLEGSRALSVEQLKQRVQECVSSDKLCGNDSVGQAIQQAMHEACENDRIVIFGSFLTVAAAIEHLQ